MPKVACFHLSTLEEQTLFKDTTSAASGISSTPLKQPQKHPRRIPPTWATKTQLAREALNPGSPLQPERSPSQGESSQEERKSRSAAHAHCHSHSNTCSLTTHTCGPADSVGSALLRQPWPSMLPQPRQSKGGSCCQKVRLLSLAHHASEKTNWTQKSVSVLLSKGCHAPRKQFLYVLSTWTHIDWVKQHREQWAVCPPGQHLSSVGQHFEGDIWGILSCQQACHQLTFKYNTYVRMSRVIWSSPSPCPSFCLGFKLALVLFKVSCLSCSPQGAFPCGSQTGGNPPLS